MVLYTGITRAKHQLTLVVPQAGVLRQAVAAQVARWGFEHGGTGMNLSRWWVPHAGTALGTATAVLAAVFAMTTALLCHTLVTAQTAVLAPAPLVAPSGAIWDSGDGFALTTSGPKLQKTRQSASGSSAVTPGQQRVCLVVFDEGTQAEFATVKEGALLPDPQALASRA